MVMAFPSLSFLFIFATFFFSNSRSIPFIVIHGIGNQCSKSEMKSFTQELSSYSGAEGYCVEIGNGSWDSWFMPVKEQTEILCEKVKQMEELKEGYNIIGLSQGNLIGRGVVEFCEGGPPVKIFISLAGPHAGTASVPLCGSRVLCIIADNLIKGEIYNTYIQEHLAPSGYLKLPNAIPDYLKNCRFLPMLNNEIPNHRNSTYKERFSSLQSLVLIMFQHDSVLIPKETSWFGCYPDGCFMPVLQPQETQLYIEDWIGLRTLDQVDKVHYVSVPGDHLQISSRDIKKYVVPYLKDLTSPKDSTNKASLWSTLLLDESLSYWWPKPFKTFIGELIGINEEESI